MGIRISEKINTNIKSNEINIIIEANSKNKETEKIFDYIANYKANKVIVTEDYKSFYIDYKNIILFYSNGKNNYCKTVDNKTYKIRSKLYEIENIDDSFIRISKKCIVNVNFVKCFDMSETRKKIVKLYDDTEEKVSRRRIKDVLNFLEDKSL